jgi:nucleoid DNA-binding protein
MVNATILYRKIASNLGHSITKEQVKEVFDAYQGIVKAGLAWHDETMLPGLGKFVTKVRKERMGQNPMTKEPIVIQSKVQAHFLMNPTIKKAGW